MDVMTQEAYALSPQQQRAWKERRQDDRLQAACRLDGPLDARRLWQAVRQVIAAHEIFRTQAVRVSGRKYPLQKVAADAAWEVADEATWQGDPTDAEALFAWEARGAAFREDGAPLRFALVSAAPGQHVLLVSASVLWADARTLHLLFREIARAYASASVGEDGRASGEGEEAEAAEAAGETVQYADYAAWRNELSTQDDDLRAEAERHWRRQAQAVEAFEQRRPARRAGLASHAGGAEADAKADADARAFADGVSFVLSAEDVAPLRALGGGDAGAIARVLLACWGALIARCTASEDVVIGLEVSGRPYDELRDAMGPYAEPVPLVLPCGPDRTLSAIIEDVRDRVEQAALWQSYHRWPEAAEDSAFPAFGFTFASSSERHEAGDVTFRVWRHRGGADRFALLLDVRPDQDRIEGLISGHPRLFLRAEAEAYARRLERLCAAVAERPAARVADLPVLTQADEHLLLHEWNHPPAPVSPGCVHEQIGAQAARTPEATAVVCEGRSLTYRELTARAARLATRLRALGVGPDTPVCLLVGRSVDQIVALLAVLQAGGAYVPLDVSYPVKERIAHVLRETRTPVVLTHTRFRDYLAGAAAAVICLDEPEPPEIASPAVEPAVRVGPENLAYIIYTSGSTGTPKGVGVRHRSVLHLWDALQEAIYAPLGPGPLRVTLNAPLSFDASVKQIIALLGGHALHILPEDVRGDPAVFVHYLRDAAIDVLDCTPSHLRALLDAGLTTPPDGMRTLPAALIGGEAIDETLWRQLGATPGTAFYNVYGPTECTVDSTAVRIDADRPASIGAPLRNVTAYVLDASMRLQPPGAPGDLYIGGEGLARGYCARPDLTADRFVPNPFSDRPGARLYRTGDLAAHLPDGTLGYIGRADHQVKLRGFRVELDEIGAVLLAHPELREAVVAIADHSGSPTLVAYIVPAAGATPSVAALRAFLEARLPDYMIPVAWVTLDALPISAHGKVDRRALPAPEPARPELSSEFQSPETDVEIRLAQIWSSVLDIPRVGVRDNFFELGGHSLLAMRMVARMRKEFAMDIALPKLFQRPTIAALAEIVEEHASAARPESSRSESAIPALPR